jgi:cell division protein FtsB
MRISIRTIFFACVLVGGAAFGITILHGPHASAEKRRQIELLEKENQVLHGEIESKQNYLERLKRNPDELELEIKHRLGLVNPGSKSFILQDGTKVDKTGPDGTGPDAAPRQPENGAQR